MTPEEKRLKSIEYYKTATPCCSDRASWYKRAVKQLEDGALKVTTPWDVCYCISGFGYLSSIKVKENA